MTTTLPTDSNERKNIPMLMGCLRYFPAALAGVAANSKLGNDKHNPGQEMHHARGKSGDHGDCIIRHLMDIQDLLAKAERDAVTPFGKATKDAVLTEANQLAWRALALSQEIHERFGGAPLAPGAKVELNVPRHPLVYDPSLDRPALPFPPTVDDRKFNAPNPIALPGDAN